MKQVIRVFAIAGMALAAAGLAVGADSAKDDIALLKKASRGFSEVAKKAIPAVVYVKVERTITMRRAPMMGFPFDLFGEMPDDPSGRPGRERPNGPRFRQQGEGSGFLISKDGFILSNCHVVDGAEKIKVRLHDGRELDAKLIGADPRSDVAVLKVEGKNFPFLTFGDSEAIEVGEWVIAVGNPFGLNESLSVGVVSAKGRHVGLADYENLIQTDAAINPGNSGGPLLNIDGNVIGITSSIFSQSGGHMGIGFAVPINMAASIQSQLMKSGKIVRGYLGVFIQDMTPELAKSFELEKEEPGLIVSSVEPDSPAAKAGLLTGDVILEQDGKPVKDSLTFRNGIALLTPGDSIKLTIRREKAVKSLSVTVGQQQQEEAMAEKARPTELSAKLGVTMEPLSSEARKQLELAPEAGVAVAAVEPGSPAAGAGLEAGHVILGVNRHPVGTVEEFQTALEHSAKTGRVLLLVKTPRFTRFVVIPLE